ncbi:unnamed protein product [Cylindrotheca closterium]|uniref:Uncharacterized protein n=1 Tax=Cylindrotheca closterium TaxID=2856 RepID=A0AAD2D067_9STRA|nr:unnamed protein product [Cylindrotheca closterium]
MNLPHEGAKEKKLPEQAKGNPAYEQTPEDMPLWCCGRNCGRNSRLTVFVLSFIGILCSIFLCLSHDYFKFTSIRNDTFYDEDKQQPLPFEYATVAKVGLFWYQIDEVFIYPWPPPRERMLFSDMLQDEVKRIQSNNPNNNDEERKLQLTVTSTSIRPSSTPSLAPSMNPSTPTVSESPTGAPSGSGVPTVSHEPSIIPSASAQPTTSAAPSASKSPSYQPSIEPSGAPTVTAAPSKCVPPLEPGAAIDCELASKSPTMSPTSAPTITNPNDIVAATTQLGKRLKYEKGMDQFDSVFYNAQLGGILGPVFCGLAFLTGTVEYCCCMFKCSWLPTAIFLYLAFMFQMFTLFLFLSDDFCKYDQECRLGFAGFGTILATLCYFICQMLICCTPRPQPLFNLMKPKPKRVKKRSGDGAAYDDGEYYDDDQYFDDEYYDDEGTYDPHNDDGTYDQSRGYNDDPSYYTENTGGYDDQPRGGMGTVPEDQSYYSNDQYDDGTGSYYTDDQGYDDGTYDDGTYNQGYDDGTQYDDQSRFDQSAYSGDDYTQGTGQYDDDYDRRGGAGGID